MYVSLKNGEGKLEVTLVDSKSREEVSKDTYDSIFYATGRRADTSGIGLETVGIEVRPSEAIKGESFQSYKGGGLAFISIVTLGSVGVDRHFGGVEQEV